MDAIHRKLVHMRKTIYLLLLTCFLAAASSCSKKDDGTGNDPYPGLDEAQRAVVRTIVPANGEVRRWMGINIAKANSPSLDWENFMLTVVRGMHDGKFIIKYTSNLPEPLERVPRYKKVWPITGQLRIGSSIDETSVDITRYIERTEGMLHDHDFSRGRLEVMENGRRMRIIFTIESGSNTLMAAGLPDGEWIFTLEQMEDSA